MVQRGGRAYAAGLAEGRDVRSGSILLQKSFEVTREQ
jgi:hypothetical protein